MQGEVFVDPAMPNATAAERRSAYIAMAQTLAKIHNVDYRRVGLQKFGRHHGYCSRQVLPYGRNHLLLANLPKLNCLNNGLQRIHA